MRYYPLLEMFAVACENETPHPKDAAFHCICICAVHNDQLDPWGYRTQLSRASQGFRVVESLAEFERT